MRIEPIQPKYFDESQQVVKAAFETAKHSDGDEFQLIKRLRQSADYRPQYDAIALNDAGQVIGHAMLSLAHVGQTPIFVLAPLAVLPAYRNQGVGGALITYLEVTAGEDMRRAISILGDPKYYGRFGYTPAADFDITPPAGIPAEYFLIKPLFDGALAHVTGELQYAAEFQLD
ncbi:GNAT family N-acetyltransferase [Lacticaseibacillus sp. N501-2]|uniref:GNAT family N-acetyltransferase n=1 Tax=Lacticaseibacillus salsurae TaxID=3367729 RepID=UPI0038B3788F